MSSIASIIRTAVLLALFATAALGILSEPQESSQTWASEFIISKAVGFGAFALGVALYKRWHPEISER